MTMSNPTSQQLDATNLVAYIRAAMQEGIQHGLKEALAELCNNNNNNPSVSNNNTCIHGSNIGQFLPSTLPVHLTPGPNAQLVHFAPSTVPVPLPTELAAQQVPFVPSTLPGPLPTGHTTQPAPFSSCFYFACACTHWTH